MTNDPTLPINEVHIRVAQDEDAARITAVLEALGYVVLRELDEGDGPARLRWAVTRLASAHKLTDREQDILERVLDGRNNQQIGTELSISRATVKWHMHNIFAKTNTGNRESLLRLALQLGGNHDGAAIRDSSDEAHTPATSVASRRPATSLSTPTVMAQVRPKSTPSIGGWRSDEVTARLEFDRAPSAESIPSKRLF